MSDYGMMPSYEDVPEEVLPPAGSTQVVRIRSAEAKPTKRGGLRIAVVAECLDGGYSPILEGLNLPDDGPHREMQTRMLVTFCRALQLPNTAGKSADEVARDMVGRFARAKIKHEEYGGRQTARVAFWAPPRDEDRDKYNIANPTAASDPSASAAAPPANPVGAARANPFGRAP